MALASKGATAKEESVNIPLEFLKKAQDAVELAEKRSTMNMGLRELKVSPPVTMVFESSRFQLGLST